MLAATPADAKHLFTVCVQEQAAGLIASEASS